MVMPEGESFDIPSACECEAQDCPMAHPPISMLSRQLRTESLPMFYAMNIFRYHTLRYSCDSLFDHLRSIAVWGVKNVKYIDLQIGELAMDHPFTIRCGDGLWELFRFLATTETVIKFTCDRDGNFAALNGAIGLANECWNDGIMEERDLRSVFDDWLQLLSLKCSCKNTEYREGRTWFACSRSQPTGDEVDCHPDHESSMKA